jgi:hypothetical protein
MAKYFVCRLLICFFFKGWKYEHHKNPKKGRWLEPSQGRQKVKAKRKAKRCTAPKNQEKVESYPSHGKKAISLTAPLMSPACKS